MEARFASIKNDLALASPAGVPDALVAVARALLRWQARRAIGVLRALDDGKLAQFGLERQEVEAGLRHMLEHWGNGGARTRD